MELSIGNTISSARRAKNMTQEMLAGMMGVSAAAVSKWETNASYPDITLLSPLARALDLTVDALLDFHASPSAQEQDAISDRLRTVFDEQGFAAGQQAAEAVLREYPTSGSLKLLVGSLYFHYLASALNQAEDTTLAANELMTRCLTLYEQAEHQTEDASEKLLSKTLRINALTMLSRYEEAEQLIDSLPQKQFVNPDDLRLTLLLAQEKWQDAEVLARRNLLVSVQQVSTMLISLTTIFRRQKKYSDTVRFVDAFCALDRLFLLEPSNGLLLRMMLAHDEGNSSQLLDLFEQYVDAQLKYSLDYRSNPFFTEAQTSVPTPHTIAEMLRLTLRSIAEDEMYDSIRDEPRFRSALDRFRAAIPAD